jgi:TnpA family transposase
MRLPMYRELKRRMPQRSVLDILANLEHWSHFTRHFTSALGQQSHAKDAPQRYVLTVFTYGCNLGPTQMEQHSRAITGRVVSRLNRQHITHDSLEAARRDIIHYYKRLDLPNYWGKGTAAAADGTLFDVYRHNLLAEYHIRYGRYGGIAYHHVSDTYIALFSHFIACGMREAVYILDGLLKNRSDIQPDTLHADTHGQSETVYGLAYLLGIQLMPRIKRWHELAFYRSTSTIRYQHIDAVFSDKVNWRLIVQHWYELMQIIVSIRVGRLMPSTLLRKLGNYSSKNRIHQAFQELGRVVRTVFLLRYIASDKLRRKIHAATTIVEAYHKLTKWCSFGEHGVIKTNDPVEQEKRVKYTDLVACAIILQNAVDMTQVLRQMTKEGYSITNEMIARCSPYLNKHIRLFGEYVLDMSQPPPPLELDTPLFPISYHKT